MTAPIHLALAAMFASALAASSFASPREEARRGRSSGQVAADAGREPELDRAEIVLADGRRVPAERVLPVGERGIVEWRRPGGDRDESAPFDEVVAILWTGRGSPGKPSAILVLQSGERFPGRLDRGTGELRWMHPWLGPIAIDLERVRSIEVEAAAWGDAGWREAEGDRVRLANGDVIEGLVTELDRECVVESLADGSVRRVPLEVVARIDLLESEQAPGAIRLVARDGTVVDVERFGMAPTSLREQMRRDTAPMITIAREGVADPPNPSARETVIPLRDFSAMLIGPSRVESLASIAPTVEPIDPSQASGADDANGATVRSWIPAPVRAGESTPIGDRDVDFTGPARIRYSVAEGSVLSTTAVLPDTMRRFGDFELVLFDGRREVLRHRFNRDAPRLEIAAAIETGELVLELREGRYGPVQDRLRLESPLLIAPAP